MSGVEGLNPHRFHRYCQRDRVISMARNSELRGMMNVMPAQLMLLGTVTLLVIMVVSVVLELYLVRET